MESVACSITTEAPTPVIRRFSVILMFMSMFFVIGGHWAAMQTFAWASMINTYSAQTGSLSAGIEKTFSGKAPCDKCRLIKEARQKEQKSPDSIKAEKTSESFLAIQSALIPVPRCNASSFPPVKDIPFSLRGEEPPSPVPLKQPLLFRSLQAV